MDVGRAYLPQRAEMSSDSSVGPLIAFMGLSWGVGVQAGGETGITGRKKAWRQFKYLVLKGKRMVMSWRKKTR